MNAPLTLFVVVIAGCGGAPAPIGPSDASDATTEGATVTEGGSDSGDAEPPPSRCDRTKPFGPPEPLTLSVVNVATPRISGDGLRLYYQEDFQYLRMAERASLVAPWGAPTTLMNIIGGLAPSSDELRLYTQQTNIVLFERASRLLPFPINPQPVNIQQMAAIFLSYDGTEMFGAMQLPQKGLELVSASTTDGKTFQAPVPLVATGSTFDELHPTVAANGVVMYFASNRPGGKGQADVYTSIRLSPMYPWSAPVLVNELSSPQEDVPGSISPDLCEMFMTVEYKLHVARRGK